MRRFFANILLLCLLSVGLAAAAHQPAFAASLQIQPLLYRETFQPGEIKKGYIDVSNGDAATVELVTEVQAFRQIDNQGTLQFFDSPQMSQAVTPDLKVFELQPHEALRLFFAVDSKKLPGGDNFAALFVRTKGDAKNGIAASVRVGTLLVLQNGKPGPRDADVEQLDAGTFQWGKGAKAAASVKNIADPSVATAFFPAVRASLWPFGGSVNVSEPPDSPLIFAGITRQVSLEIPTNLIGFYRLDVTAGHNTKSTWVFLVTGWWRWGAVVFILLAPVLAALWWIRRNKRHIHYKTR